MALVVVPNSLSVRCDEGNIVTPHGNHSVVGAGVLGREVCDATHLVAGNSIPAAVVSVVVQEGLLPAVFVDESEGARFAWLD